MDTKETAVDPQSIPHGDTAPHGPKRRTFIAGAAATAAGIAAAGYMWHEGFGNPYTQKTEHGKGDADDSYTASDVLYSMCMQCNTFCTIKVRLTDAPEGSEATALVRKIAGNPYSPLTTQPLGPIPYDTDPEDAVAGIGDMARDSKSRSGGMACLKGQAGIQIVHDAKRITSPLKRVGKRGSGKWKSISWDEAIKEILDGSDLGTPGLRSWWAFAPQKPVMADWDKVKDGTMTQSDFAAKWGDKLIDAAHPDLGPKANLLTVLGGDRMEFIGSRFANQVFGTINQFNHGGTCGMSGVMGNVQTHPTSKHKRMYADIDYCRYLIVWGTEPLTAQKGPTWLAPRIGKARENGMKLVVVDPRLSNTAQKADVWLPVKPGHDTELAFAIARWIIDHKRYGETYLRAPGQQAATAIGEPTWSDATHLVKVDDPTRQVLNMVDLGRAEEPAPLDDGTVPEPERAVLVDGSLTGADSTADLADLDVDTTVETPSGPVHVRSVFNLVKERLHEHEIADLAQACGIEQDTIEQVAHDFTNYGKQAAIMSYRGAAMHTNGFHAVQAINYINFLIGNEDWKGGKTAAVKTYSPYQGRYNLEDVDGANTAWGIPITREKSKYEKSSFFEEEGYPAKRRWYPYPGNLCHEVLPSIAEGYPYTANALFIHRHNPLNSSPGAHRQAAILQDTEKIKLLVCFDITVGDTAMFADFILPDQTYLERFTQEPIYPNQQFAVTQLGQPTLRAFKGPRPVEETYRELAVAMGLPGVGENAFGPGAHYNTYEDYWLKMAANVAYAGQKPVPDANQKEIELFTRAHTRALGEAYDESRWRAAVTEEEWPKVVYVLNRGGRFEGDGGLDEGYEGDWLKYRYGGLCAFYANKVAAGKDSYTGEFFDGFAQIDAAHRYDGSDLPKAGPLVFTNWKSRNQGTYRTVNSAWLREIRPSNYVWVNPTDADPRGIKNGDHVKVTSSSAQVEGIAMVTEGIRPGVIGADSAYGQKGYFATPVEIDGTVIEPPQKYGHNRSYTVTPMHEEIGIAGTRGEGFAVNTLLDDDTTAAGGISDPIGGGAAQLFTWVELTKA
ncbi:MAG: molybdopterin-dependent oxidoreductase [Ancrocorticia sp.]|jgi:anaerobic selenocysteine-containing dehydrogenase|nr:molybdopterin-dependent oxidoreductase [Ancrocorticia sp.]